VNDTNNSTDVAGGIVFGSSKDTNLFRDAANSLTTQDRLIIGTSASLGLRWGTSTGGHIYQDGSNNMQWNTASSGYIYLRGSSAGIIYLGAPADTANIQLRRDVVISDDKSFTTGGGRIKRTTRVTTTYTILVTDEVVFGNTDSAGYTVTLPAGVEGQQITVVNSGSSGNNLTIAVQSGEDIYGVTNGTHILADAESAILTYNATDGWY
jgi:hypothetical protein